MKWIAQNRPLVVVLALTAIVAWYRLRPASMAPAPVEAYVDEPDRSGQPIASVGALTKLGQVEWELPVDGQATPDSHGPADPFAVVHDGAGEFTDVAAESGWPELRLTAIMTGAGTPVAIINDRIVEPGTAIGEVHVRRIDPYAVELELGGRRMTMKLQND